MIVPLKYVAIGLAIGIGAQALPVCADEDVKTVPTERSKSAYIDLDFPGGTIGGYVDALRKTAKREVNVLLTTPDARDVPFPPVSLKSVDLRSAVQLLESETRHSDGQVVRVRVEEVPRNFPDAAPVYRVTTERFRVGRDVPRDVKVWALAGVLSDEMSAEDILTAVETAIGLLGGDREPAEIRFHEATALLVAAGDPGQLSAIDRIVDRLHETVHIQSEAAALGLEAMDKANEGLQWIMEFGAEQEDLKGQVDRVHAHVVELEQRLAQKTREAEELRGQHEAGIQHRERLLMEMEHLRNQLREKDHIIGELERKTNRGGHE